MSRTIKAIERHMRMPVRLGPQSKAVSVQSYAAKLVAEWQQHGPETLSGLAGRKLRLSFAPTQSVLIASAAG
jgi:hypothetical protein